jgi:hypothetical protein
MSFMFTERGVRGRFIKRYDVGSHTLFPLPSAVRDLTLDEFQQLQLQHRMRNAHHPLEDGLYVYVQKVNPPMRYSQREALTVDLWCTSNMIL